MPKRHVRILAADRSPLEADVRVKLRGPRHQPLVARTTTQGLVEFHATDAQLPCELLVSPLVPGSWTTALEKVNDGDVLTIEALPTTFEPWWLDCLGIPPTDATRGSGIRIGIVDDGFHANGSTMPAYQLIDCNGAIVAPSSGEGWGHGEAVWKLLTNAAPGASVTCVAVASPEAPGLLDTAGASSAIAYLAARGVDLINISAGAHTHLRALDAAVVRARNLGTLVIAATGNEGENDVAYPARLDPCVGVGAIGKMNWAPKSSFAHLEQVRASHSNCVFSRPPHDLHFARLSNFGAGLDVIAPGVGLLIDAGNGGAGYDVTGTSFAAPLVTALLAVHLSTDSSYRAGPRDSKRVDYARAELEDLCDKVGLVPTYEGWGLPSL